MKKLFIKLLKENRLYYKMEATIKDEYGVPIKDWLDDTDMSLWVGGWIWPMDQIRSFHRISNKWEKITDAYIALRGRQNTVADFVLKCYEYFDTVPTEEEVKKYLNSGLWTNLE